MPRNKPMEKGHHLYKADYWTVQHAEVVDWHSTCSGRYYDLLHDNGWLEKWVKVKRSEWLDDPVKAWEKVIHDQEDTLEYHKRSIKERRLDIRRFKTQLEKAKKLKAQGKPVPTYRYRIRQKCKNTTQGK